MTETPGGAETPFIQQSDFERITQIVSTEFQLEESLLEHGIPTYYLKQPQQTKQQFLRLLKNLETINMIAFLRKMDRRVVLRVVPKPQVKPSNLLLNLVLFLATIATTFVTGYMLSPSMINPLIGGTTFTIAIIAVLGTHEMGHKLTADRKGMAATPPYFIPGPPPFGTFGAVIMQKSLPPNKDSLFDIGADGPIAGFIIATIVSIIGLTLLVPSPPPEGSTTLQIPFIWTYLAQLIQRLNLMPHAAENEVLLLHPIAFAGWVGMIVTMLNLLPAGMLDGGHVARSIMGDKARMVLSALSIIYLILEGFYPMAILVLFMSMAKHPGPLDDVSSLSRSRKLMALVLVAIFLLCTFPQPPNL